MSLMCKKKYVMPLVLKEDKKYFSTLEEKLRELQGDIETLNVDKHMKNRLSTYADGILKSLDDYFKGDMIEAYFQVEELVKTVKDCEGIVTNIRNSYVFQGKSKKVEEVQLFRARLNDRMEDYSAKQMLHIPFDHRELVGTQRFSIPGLPSLYFGNSSYCCWLELERPEDCQFNVSPAVIDDQVQFFNLTFTIRDVSDYISLNNKQDSIDPEYIELLLKMLMLNIATSYKVSNNNRKFKSEYIFSQMLMLACKRLGMNGIIYYSKQVSDELFSRVSGVNVVLFATYQGDRISDVCNHLKIGRSFNYSMYKELLQGQTYKDYPLNIDNSPWINRDCEKKSVKV